MRFLIGDGGRYGFRSAEELKDWFKACWDIECNVDSKIEYKPLLIDFSETNDQQGEVFKFPVQFLTDMQNHNDQARFSFHGCNMPSNDVGNIWLALAHRYWSEAEAKLLAKVTKPRRKKPVLRRKTL